MIPVHISIFLCNHIITVGDGEQIDKIQGRPHDLPLAVNPLLSPLLGLFISSPFEGKGGGLDRDGGPT